jgi:ATP-dependent DNA helicase DinG
METNCDVREAAEKISAILGPGGIVSRSIPAYENREQQIKMAIEVFNALDRSKQLIVEAPTGTGKTLAYLVAAALSGKRVAISTGTKNLQEQLFLKDVPFVRAEIFPGLRSALLKGRGNFVCHTRFQRFLRQPVLQGIDNTDSLKIIRDWYSDTCKIGNGDREEIHNLAEDDPIWNEICSTTDSCLGKKCPDKEACFVFKMRQRAFDVDLMVVNHHLLASDLEIKESGFGEVIPKYEALIVDEAHGLEEALTQHFGFKSTLPKINRLIRDARAELKQASVSGTKFSLSIGLLEDLGARLFRFYDKVPAQRTRIDPPSPAILEVRDKLCEQFRILEAMLANLADKSETFLLIAGRCFDARNEIETILSQGVDGDYACWSERKERFVTINASPIEVGNQVRKRLYEKVPGLVFTSATLSSGGNFDYFKSRLGLENGPNLSEVILGSPFDYKKQTLLFIPKSIPVPTDPNFVNAAAEIVKQVLQRTFGRAFVLFTSYRNMEAVYSLIDGQIPYKLMIQGSMPKSRLLEKFKEVSGAVLFATSSFWEGVDVQGDSLSCVIIDRLPFASPGDPIVSARIDRLKKNDTDTFYSFQVPMAVLALKQGLGRLIRTRSDRGVLCILDIRIINKSYGKVFMKSLHGSPVGRDLEDIEKFFSGKAQ